MHTDTEHGKRKTVTSLDVVYALKRAGKHFIFRSYRLPLITTTYAGKTLYGFGV